LQMGCSNDNPARALFGSGHPIEPPWAHKRSTFSS
jgi:hypothetical protein